MPVSGTDRELLAHYTRGDNDAFAELVRRHTPLVYSAALRQTRQPCVAEEVTQAVFVLLSARAGRLSGQVILTAWLYRAARFAAKDAMKKQRRRQFYESKAAVLESAVTGDVESVRIWSNVAPMLDDAMESLREKDRTAVLLRFFEGQSLREVGVATGTTESAAGQRVSRAIDRLRQFFAARGLSIPAVGLGTAIAGHAIGSAPASLATAAAVAAAAPSSTLISIAKGATQMMFWTRPKILAAAASLAISAIAVPTAVLVSGSRVDGNAMQQSAASTQPLSIALQDGGTLQICLGELDGATHRLWNPDGSLLDPQPFQLVGEKLAKPLKPDERRVAALIRAVDSHGKNIAESFSGANDRGFRLGGAHVEKDGKPLKEWWVQISTVGIRQNGFEVDLGLASGDWHKLATWGTYGQTGKMLTDDRGYVAEAGIPGERKGELFIAMAIQLPQLTGWDERVVANLANGEHQPDSTKLNMRLMNGVGMTSFVWRELGINPEDVSSYDLEIRPQLGVALKDLPAMPGASRRANVQITPPHALPKMKP